MWEDNTAVGSGSGRTAVRGGEDRECQADIYPYKSADAKILLKNKFIVIIGDSNSRSLYKDLICLLQYDRLCTDEELKSKCEETILNDELVFRTVASNSTTFVEMREFGTPYNIVQFVFTTRCYNATIETIIQEWDRRKLYPDIVIMNSTLWDTSRYTREVSETANIGPKENDLIQDGYCVRLHTVMRRMRAVLPAKSMTLWLTCLPVASQLVGGFLGDEVAVGEQVENRLRTPIMTANQLAAQCAQTNGWDVLDMHWYILPFIAKWRMADGVHWYPRGYRHVTQLILLFIADAMCAELPPGTAKLLKELDIADPNSKEFKKNMSAAHPMESLASPGAIVVGTKLGDFAESNKPEWRRDLIHDTIFPAYLISRHRLLLLKKLQDETGLNNQKLRKLILFGDIKSPLEKALERGMINTRDYQVSNGIRIAQMPADLNETEIDTVPIDIVMPTQKNSMAIASEFERFKITDKYVERWGRGSSVPGTGINEQKLHDNWLDVVLPDDYDQNDFEFNAERYVKYLATVYGSQTIDKLFDKLIIDNAEPAVKRQKTE